MSGKACCMCAPFAIHTCHLDVVLEDFQANTLTLTAPGGGVLAHRPQDAHRLWARSTDGSEVAVTRQ